MVMNVNTLYLKNEDTGEFVPATSAELRVRVERGRGTLSFAVQAPDSDTEADADSDTGAGQREGNATFGDARSESRAGPQAECRATPRLTKAGPHFAGAALGALAQALAPLVPLLEQAAVAYLQKLIEQALKGRAAPRLAHGEGAD